MFSRSGASSVPTQSFVSLVEVGESLFGAPVLGDDRIGLCCPDEWFWVGIAVIDPFDDGGLEFVDAVEGAAADALASISADRRSTRLSQEQDVGVKCSLQRGLRLSQRFTASVLCVL